MYSDLFLLLSCSFVKLSDTVLKHIRSFSALPLFLITFKVHLSILEAKYILDGFYKRNKDKVEVIAIFAKAKKQEIVL